MITIDETTFSRLLDAKLGKIRPLYIEKNWEAYYLREPVFFEGLALTPGMVLEQDEEHVVRLYASDQEFLQHLEHAESGIPPELRARLQAQRLIRDMAYV